MRYQGGHSATTPVDQRAWNVAALRCSLIRLRKAIGTLAILAGAAACARYEPSTEPGISLPKFEKTVWPTTGRPLLDYYTGSPQKGTWSGIHVDADGSVWSYAYERSNASPECNLSEPRRDKAAFYACRYARTRLVAQLSSELVENLSRSALALSEKDRLRADANVNDGGFSGIEVTGYARTDGKAFLVAGCGTPRLYEQVLSKDANEVIELWRRLRRALPKTSRAMACFLLPREVAPGVNGWWVPGP
jgi:hypothetical protein